MFLRLLGFWFVEFGCFFCLFFCFGFMLLCFVGLFNDFGFWFLVFFFLFLIFLIYVFVLWCSYSVSGGSCGVEKFSLVKLTVLVHGVVSLRLSHGVF